MRSDEKVAPFTMNRFEFEGRVLESSTPLTFYPHKEYYDDLVTSFFVIHTRIEKTHILARGETLQELLSDLNDWMFFVWDSAQNIGFLEELTGSAQYQYLPVLSQFQEIHA